MYSMSKCNSNGTLSTTLSSVSFNTTTGIATFSNLTINLKGMYTIMMNVKTLNSNDYSFSCISQPVLVKASKDSILTATSDEPDIYLTFTGNFTAQSTDSLKAYQAMLYNCMLSSYGILIQRQISLYAGSVKAAIGTSGDASAYTSLANDLNSSNFSLADGVVLQLAIINGQTYNFTSLVSSPSSSSDSSISQQNAV
jgi:hypothetical protein